MKINKITTLFLCGLSLAGMTSCYDTVLDFNDTKNQGGGNSTYTSVKTPELAVQMLRKGQEFLLNININQYQYERSLHMDDYAGYLSVPHNFEHRLTSSYYFNQDFGGGIVWELKRVAPQTIPVCNSADSLGIPSIGAAAKIMFCYGALQFTNVHGPIPYNDFKALKENHPLVYEKQSDVYTELFADLIQADSLLAAYQAKPNDKTNSHWEEMDRISDYTKAPQIIAQWRKMANSMILRMAVTAHKRTEYTFKGKSLQKLAEEAVARGVFQAGDPIFGWICGPNTDAGYNKAAQICSSWNDSRLNASFDNILLRVNNPLRDKWFTKNKDFTAKSGKKYPGGTDIMSIRSGTMLPDRSASSSNYKMYSYLGDNFLAEPMTLMRPEEVIFLRAEAALYGWNMGGTAQAFYEAGIKESFNKRGLSNEQYENYMKRKGLGDASLSNQKSKYTYTDYYSPNNSLKMWDDYYTLNNAWGGIDTNPSSNPSLDKIKEVQLEKIITQKWIAIFPESVVAWTDYRRTGYPRLLPACKDAYKDCDGSVYDDIFNSKTGAISAKRLSLRRMPYCETTDNEILSDVIATAIPNLNLEATGKVKGDMQGTRLWWDVETTSNF